MPLPKIDAFDDSLLRTFFLTFSFYNLRVAVNSRPAHISVDVDCIDGRQLAPADRIGVNFAEHAIWKLARIAGNGRKTGQRRICALDIDSARLHGRVATKQGNEIGAAVCMRVVANNDGRILIIEADALARHDDAAIVSPKEFGELRTAHIRLNARGGAKPRLLLQRSREIAPSLRKWILSCRILNNLLVTYAESRKYFFHRRH